MAGNPSSSTNAQGNDTAEAPRYPSAPGYMFGWVDKKSPLTPVWVLEGNPEAHARYQAVFDADLTLTSQVEGIRRAGGTFYKYCMCIILTDYRIG